MQKLLVKNQKTIEEEGIIDIYEQSLEGLMDFNPPDFLEVEKIEAVETQKVDKEQKKIEMLINDLKSIIPNESNESFFGESGIVMDRKGGAGKSYNAAKLILHTVLYTKNRILFTTTINENVERLYLKILEVIESEYEKSGEISEPIEDLLEDKKFNMLKILKMTGYSSLSEDAIEASQAITTNHTYGYPKGTSSKYFSNMEYLAEIMGKNDIIIKDEFHEFVEKSIVQIPINNFYMKKPDGIHEFVYANTESPFKPCTSSEYEENIFKHRGTLPAENRSYTYNKRGAYKALSFKLENNPRFEESDIKRDFLKYVKINPVRYEYEVRAKGIFFKDEKEDESYRIRRYNVVQNLERKEDAFTIEKTDFIQQILDTMVGGVFVTQHCCIDRIIGKDEETGELEFEEIESFDKRKQLFEFIKANFENYIEIWDNSIYKQLNMEGKELFKEYFVFRQKSVFEMFNSKKYYMTATTRDTEKWGYEVNRDFANDVFFHCDYEVLFIQRDLAIDKYIIDLSTKLGRKKYMDVLAFTALAEPIKEIINKEDKNKIKNNSTYTHVDLVTAVEDLKSHEVSCGGTDGTGTKKTCRNTYLNGTEATGIDYGEKNAVIINSRPEKNIKSRIIIKKWGTHEVVNLDDIDLNQATFRIHRGTDEKLKFIIFVGDNIEIAKKYVDDMQGSTNKYTLVNVPTTEIETIAEYINIKIGIYNHGLEADTPVFDRRKTTKNANAKKYDSAEIIRLYEEAKTEYLEQNPNKKNLSLRMASEMLGMPKTTIARALK